MTAPPTRQSILRSLALAEPAELAAVLQRVAPEAPHTVVRGPETGLVMVRGRIGGGGAPFNAGEATVSRCVVRLASGEVGFGHVMGRDGTRARQVALLDALAQTPAHATAVAKAAVTLERDRLAREAGRAREVAATRVDFFTMVRGED
ncbi:phosphonate C-P lyase system protein PhnG [Acuticoccus sediminis]|uniref:Phosphonate C-P lyase system protein PhnG n=1 Tax=Acuticoccus sediminis TaxID=2184697 RepID=A0A8B2P0K6_9HYPH|nr:phosphonate C-P lyase system protein PhnG [Acuticoccus sediminis]RAI03985.1 phosphonate C-P lyase system protein PhnG [Acuticoccus sediminis]